MTQPTTPVSTLRGWSTAAEIQFINGMAEREEAITLLRGYIAGMQRRTDTRDLEVALCIRVAKEHLDEQIAKVTGMRRQRRAA